MPSITGFIQSLLSEDMYATDMLTRFDERIAELNDGQLRLMVEHCEKKVATLTGKTVLGAYAELLRKSKLETERRYEEETRGKRERVQELKAAHAGVNAKAWDTAHAGLDRELAKFQKFLASKARRVAEEEVLQEEMEKLNTQLLSLPARRVVADSRRSLWWAIAVLLAAIFAPIIFLSLYHLGTWPAAGSSAACLGLAFVCCFIGFVRGTVLVPTIDDDDIESKTRKRAREKLKAYRAEVRKNYNESEELFAAEMKWREEWAKENKKMRREVKKGQREAVTQGEGFRVAPGEEINSLYGTGVIPVTDEEVSEGARAGNSTPVDALPDTPLPVEGVGPCAAKAQHSCSSAKDTADDLRGKPSRARESLIGENAITSEDVIRGPCQGSRLPEVAYESKESSSGTEQGKQLSRLTEG